MALSGTKQKKRITALRIASAICVVFLIFTGGFYVGMVVGISFAMDEISYYMSRVLDKIEIGEINIDFNETELARFILEDLKE